MIALCCWGPLVRSESKAGSAKKSSPCLKGGGITGSKVGDGFSSLVSAGFSLSSRLSLLSFSFDLKRWRKAFIVEVVDGWPDWAGDERCRSAKEIGWSSEKWDRGFCRRNLPSAFDGINGNYYGVQMKKG